jgi:hypothetical protein
MLGSAPQQLSECFRAGQRAGQFLSADRTANVESPQSERQKLSASE